MSTENWTVEVPFIGVDPFSSGGNQPDTSAYRFRPVEAEKLPNKNEDGYNIKVTCQITAVPPGTDEANIGKTFSRYIPLPKMGQAGQEKDNKGRTYNEKVEGFLNQYLVCIGWDPAQVKGLGGNTVPLTRANFLEVKGQPAQGHAFYEAYDPNVDDSSSETTFLTVKEYEEVVAGARTIGLKNAGKTASAKPAGLGGSGTNAPSMSAGLGGTAAGLGGGAPPQTQAQQAGGLGGSGTAPTAGGLGGTAPANSGGAAGSVASLLN